MANEVTAQEIFLNGYRYQAKSPIVGSFIDPFPGQLSIGGDDYNNQVGTSSYVIDNLTGGIGAEKFISPNMCWFTNCIIEFPGHIFPPRLANSVTIPDVTAGVTNPPQHTDMGFESGAGTWTGDGAYGTTAPRTGTYDWEKTTSSGNHDGTQTVPWYSDYKGKQFTFKMYGRVATGAGSSVSIGIDDGVGTTFSSTYTGTAYSQLSVTRTLSASATQLKLVLRATHGGTARLCSFDDGNLYTTINTPLVMCNHNGSLYMGIGNYLAKLNAARTAFDTVKSDFERGIRALTSSINSRMYINMGDIGNYWWTGKNNLLTANAASGQAVVNVTDGSLFAATNTVILFDETPQKEELTVSSVSGNAVTMTTNLVNSYTTANLATLQVIKQSNSANAYWGVQYDAKLFKMNTSGTVTYSTDPDGATPTWTTGGAITDIADQIQGFMGGNDASGVDALYVRTKSKLKIYDSATPQWLDTKVSLPNHPNGGKGGAYFNGAHYLSYGLAVKEYVPTADINLRDIGLTERDGLPVEYNGEIVKLQGEAGAKLMFALVDASQTSGNSKSGLYAFNGSAWYCWWVDTSNNGAMYDCIVSPASSAYAVYWGVGSSVYYIDIPRGIQNPDKITQYYGTAGILLSPWFDSGDQGAAKLAKELNDFAKGITTTETVALKYRIDHTNTDLDTGWTTLETLNTTGESGYNEELFGSGAGIAFKSIQFRLDFVTAGSTAKADIQNLKLLYRKRTGALKIRRWVVDVLLNNYANGPTGNETAKAKITNLKAVLTSNTDVVFSHRPNANADESHYVNAECERFEENAGAEYQGGYYRLVLTEV